MKVTVLALLVLGLWASYAAADEGKPNCKLTIRTFMKDGEKKVDVKEVHAASKAECKQLADKEMKTDDEDVAKITVASSFRSF